jgi:hypothetical protein
MNRISILKAVPPPPPRIETGFFRRALGRFRLPFLKRSEFEAAEERHRAVRMFSMNYSKTWKR